MQNLFKAAIQPWMARRGAADYGATAGAVDGGYANLPIVDLVQQVEQIADMGFWKYELASGSVYWSPGTFAIHDLPPGERLELDNALCFYPPNYRPLIEGAMKRATEEGIGYDVELDFTSARGRKKRVRAIGKAEFKGGEVVALVGVFQDITARYEADRQLRDAAMTDDLTGLPNRRHLHQFFSDLKLESTPERHAQYALALIDLDHFKQSE